jgi:hypothetical protein
MTAYLTSQTVSGHCQEYRPASPFVDFMLAFSLINFATCQAVLDAGFLDMLLCVYICDFSSMVPDNATRVQGESMMMM